MMTYSLDKIYIGTLTINGEKKYVSLLSERGDLLFMELKTRIYYCSPKCSLNLGKGRLNSVEPIKKYIKDINRGRKEKDTISISEIEKIVFNLNKELNTNVKDIILSNIIYVKDYILNLNIKDDDKKALLNELNVIFEDYINSINKRHNEIESNSSNLIGTKIEYLKRIIVLYEKTKEYIKYSENFDNQEKEIRDSFDKLLK